MKTVISIVVFTSDVSFVRFLKSGALSLLVLGSMEGAEGGSASPLVSLWTQGEISLFAIDQTTEFKFLTVTVIFCMNLTFVQYHLA